LTVGNQKYASSTFTYATGGTALSTTPTAAAINLAKPTGAAVTGNVSWGINVPNGTVPGSYSGTNTFTAN
jgi:hypothetical protein